jgi:outer membrane protein assembly factor BamE
MRNILICFFVLGILAAVSCSKGIYSLTHHAEVQQGNVVTQEMMDRLSPGMTKRQVQIVMGTPMIVDVFQQDRWDYSYYLLSSDGLKKERTISLFFENNRLVRTAGDLAPSEGLPTLDPAQKKVSVTVPYQDRGRRGVLNRMWRFLTFRNRGDEEQP